EKREARKYRTNASESQTLGNKKPGPCAGLVTHFNFSMPKQRKVQLCSNAKIGPITRQSATKPKPDDCMCP
ncbi:hypothetical protein, partial [Enterovibrio norvegicus]|uniref:hypothetical protein n=1 Tax=Enterovibrio norvegicus TaxID=188144 RepID=UPI001A7E1B01